MAIPRMEFGGGGERIIKGGGGAKSDDTCEGYEKGRLKRRKRRSCPALVIVLLCCAVLLNQCFLAKGHRDRDLLRPRQGAEEEEVGGGGGRGGDEMQLSGDNWGANQESSVLAKRSAISNPHLDFSMDDEAARGGPDADMSTAPASGEGFSRRMERKSPFSRSTRTKVASVAGLAAPVRRNNSTGSSDNSGEFIITRGRSSQVPSAGLLE